MCLSVPKKVIRVNKNNSFVLKTSKSKRQKAKSILKVKKGDWVLDAFAGSGTTLIESKRLGRNALGFDISEEVVEESNKFIEKEENKHNYTEGWVCPKCGYVWAWWVAGCSNCNQPKVYTAPTTVS